ncbi:hypothetical protein FQR65_LT17262 [Abscondita terminalis]|nr:hypothetical protein FQR65_LT17262 [Abscondita terminalis]
MGMPIEEPIALVKEDVQINPQLLTDQINTDNRTEVKVLEKRKQLLQYNVQATKAAYYPTLSLTGNYAWQGFGPKFPIGPGKSQGVYWSDYASVDQAKIQLETLEQDLKDTKLNMSLDYRNAKATTGKQSWMLLKIRKLTWSLRNSTETIPVAITNMVWQTLTELLDAENGLVTSKILPNSLFRLQSCRSGVTKQQLDQSRLQLKNAKNTLQQSNIKVGDSNVRTLISGYINKKSVEPGAVVAPGTPLFDIVNVSRLKLQVTVNESEVAKLRVGDQINRIYILIKNFQAELHLLLRSRNASLNIPYRNYSNNNPNNELRAGYGISIHHYRLTHRLSLHSNVDFLPERKTRDGSTISDLSGKYKNVEELSNLVIAVKDGAQIRLSDVAFVEDAQKDAEKVARIDRKPAILLQVVKQSDANAVEIELPKDASVEKTNFMTQKAEDYLSKKSEVVKMNTTVGQQVMVSVELRQTAYKSEIDVNPVDKDKEADK